MAHAGRRRCERSRGAVEGHRKWNRGDQPPVADSRALDHRLRQPAQAGHLGRAQQSARRRRGEAHQGILQVSDRTAVLRPRRRARALPPVRRAWRRAGVGMEREVRNLREEASRRGRRVPGRARQGSAEGMGRRAAGLHAEGQPRDASVSVAGRSRNREKSLVVVRRLRRPERVHLHRHQGRRRLRARPLRGPQSSFWNPRARHVRDPQRHRAARRLHPVRLELPLLHRLRAPVDSAGGADGTAGGVRFHP